MTYLERLGHAVEELDNDPLDFGNFKYDQSRYWGAQELLDLIYERAGIDRIIDRSVKDKDPS